LFSATTHANKRAYQRAHFGSEILVRILLHRFIIHPDWESWLETRPAAILPGQTTKAGTRTPPSYSCALPPRSGPLLKTLPGCGPPLSLQKTSVAVSFQLQRVAGFLLQTREVMEQCLDLRGVFGLVG
jgi:hypothetical protein